MFRHRSDGIAMGCCRGSIVPLGDYVQRFGSVRELHKLREFLKFALRDQDTVAILDKNLVLPGHRVQAERWHLAQGLANQKADLPIVVFRPGIKY